MASFFDSRIFSQLAGTASNVTRDRARTYEQQFRKSGADALEIGQQLLGLFEQLPAAMIASERNEYERLVKKYGEDHPRVAAARQALAGLESFESQAALGRARVRRAVESTQVPGVAFFGFVYDESGKPLSGLTVRLRAADSRASATSRVEPLQARTAEDGYFRIPLVQDTPAPSAARTRASARKAEASAAAASSDERGEGSATVEILDERGAVVHQDPVPLSLPGASPKAAGADGENAAPQWAKLSESIYREYRIGPAETKPRAAAKPAPAKKR